MGSEERPFTGLAVARDANGRLRASTSYVDGLRQGRSEEWFEDGRLARECDFEAGVESGRCRWFHPNGRPSGEGTYRIGKLEGSWREWFEDGSPRVECEYRDGLRDGPCRRWRSAGRPEWTAVFRNGEANGPLSAWGTEGGLRLETTLLGNVPDGGWKTWHPNGALRQRGAWRDGRLDGLWEEWDETGRPLESAEWRTGERVSVRQWYPDGALRLEARKNPGSGRWSWKARGPDRLPERDSPLLRGLYPFLFVDGTPTTASPPASKAILTAEQKWSLESIRRLDGERLEEMEFSGDSGFTNFLVRGMPGRWTGVPNLDGDRQGEGEGLCSTVVATNAEGRTLFGHNNDSRPFRLLVVHTSPPKAFASVSVVLVPMLGDPDGVESLVPLTGNLVALRAPFFPMAGMNERGVAVAGMASDGQSPTFDPRRPTLSYTQMIRLILDHAPDVEGAVELVRTVNWEHWHDHLLIADRSGRSVVVESVDDRIVVVPGRDLRQVATNFRLSGREPAAWKGRCWRFDRLVDGVSNAEAKLDAVGMLRLLESASMDAPLETSFSVVFELDATEVLLAPHRDYAHPQRLSLRMAGDRRSRAPQLWSK